MKVSPTALGLFLSLSVELHFGRAAARAGVSTSTLSKQITRLESDLGVILFRRSARGVELTAAGAGLIPVAARVATAFHDLANWSEQAEAPLRPVLRIGMVAAGLGSHTAPILERFTAQHPRVRVEFHRPLYREQFTSLADGTVDVLLGPGHPQGFPPEVEPRLTMPDPRVLVVGRHHRLAQRSWVTLAETTGETYIRVGDEASTALLRSWMIDPRPDGRALVWGPHAADFETMLDLCAAGFGVNLSVESARFRNPRPDITYLPVRDAPAGVLSASVRCSSTNQLVADFVAIARQIAKRPTSRHGHPLTRLAGARR